MTTQIICGDCLEALRNMPAESVNCCVTSPPYWGLRDYGVEGQIGLEETPEAYTARLVEVFEEVRRVLKNDGTLWLNLGDSYAGKAQEAHFDMGESRAGRGIRSSISEKSGSGLKPKDLVGIPWRVAFALQAAGWYLRQDIIWHKPNPMPESVRDRCTKSHEYIFLLSKSPRYWFDHDEMQEDAIKGSANAGRRNYTGHNGRERLGQTEQARSDGRNRRDVWTVSTKPYKGAHFATFPPDLIRPCIRAGCPQNGVVLDPFAGAGTTGLVALEEGKNFIGIELNPEYVQLIKDRLEPLTSAPALSTYLEEAEA